MKQSLTDKQNEALQAIKQYQQDNGYPPTRAELSDRLGVYPNAIQLRLDALARNGHIKITRGASRGIRVL